MVISPMLGILSAFSTLLRKLIKPVCFYCKRHTCFTVKKSDFCAADLSKHFTHLTDWFPIVEMCRSWCPYRRPTLKYQPEYINKPTPRRITLSPATMLFFMKNIRFKVFPSWLSKPFTLVAGFPFQFCTK